MAPLFCSVTVLALLFLIASCYVPEVEEEWSRYIQWVPFDSSLRMAKKLKKPIFLLFYKENCPACRALSQDFRDSPAIEMLSKHFVMTKATDEQDTNSKYYPPYYPRLLFLDAEGAVMPIGVEDAEFQHFYSTGSAVTGGMVAALRRAGIDIHDPPY